MIAKTRAELADTQPGIGLFFECGQCHETLHVQIEGGTGYGFYEDSPEAEPVCYKCCADLDCQKMRDTGRAVLYLTEGSGEDSLEFGVGFKLGSVSNWPGTLKFPCGVRLGRHNIAGTRRDVWFTGPDGHEWHGVQYGESSQVCRCRRTKKRARS